MGKRGIVWGVLIVIGIVVSIFTVSSKEAVKWNDKVVSRFNRCMTAYGRFTPHVTGWIGGKTLEAASFDAALTSYGRDIGQAAAELRAQTPPDDEYCKAMHTEMVKYVDLKESHLPEIRKLCGEMKASNPGTPEIIAKVMDAFVALEKKEDSQKTVVHAKQKAMATKFKIKLQ